MSDIPGQQPAQRLRIAVRTPAALRMRQKSNAIDIGKYSARVEHGAVGTLIVDAFDISAFRMRAHESRHELLVARPVRKTQRSEQRILHQHQIAILAKHHRHDEPNVRRTNRAVGPVVTLKARIDPT